jgi:hypothetical protein
VIADQELLVDEALQRLDRFFMGEGPVHQTLRELARRLDEQGIAYAVIGAMAFFLHGYRRETVDVDLLLTREGLARFKETLIGLGYVPAFTGANKHFRDTRTGVSVDIITAGEYPGDGKPKSVAFPDPKTASESKGGIRIIKLASLIELKLASGISAKARLKDLADVQEAIKELKLPRSLGDALDPYVSAAYHSLWDGVEADRSNQSRPDYDEQPPGE